MHVLFNLLFNQVAKYDISQLKSVNRESFPMKYKQLAS